MNRLLISDTHFGYKQNSMTWLRSQLSFFDEQIIPYLQTHPDTTVIHLGDVFDSRSSISPMVATVVREKFCEIASIADEFIVLAGNHDFYSPTSDTYNTLSLVFQNSGIHLVTNDIYAFGEDMFVPWYCYKKDLSPLLERLPYVKNIYTHADILGEDRELTSLYKNYNIFSGHIHAPALDSTNHCYNLGSCFPLNFGDANQSRYAYIWDGATLQSIENEHSIKFWKIYNNSIFAPLHDKNDYYQFYINQSLLSSVPYQDRISEITRKYNNISIIPTSDDIVFENVEFETYNIADVCRASIPQHLQDKFNQVLTCD